jgi:hypothetical protein
VRRDGDQHVRRGHGRTLIPLGLRAANVDPALASSVFITTLTDVFGFFSFLGWRRSSSGICARRERRKIGGFVPLYTADALIPRTYKLGEADRIVCF